MPRAMWKGAISFGLVTIPVSVYPATEEKTLRFNQLHDEDGGRIRMKRVCSVDGEEVGYEHIVKGYEYEKDRYVILTDEDFEAVPVESSRAIDIQQFVDLEEIDPMMYKKSYYLVPEETGAKAYALLREALDRSGKVGVAKVSFRDKEHLAALRFRDGVGHPLEQIARALDRHAGVVLDQIPFLEDGNGIGRQPNSVPWGGRFHRTPRLRKVLVSEGGARAQHSDRPCTDPARHRSSNRSGRPS